MSMKRYKYTKELVDKIIFLYIEEQLSTKSISSKLNMGEWSIWNCLKKNKIKLRDRFAFSQKYEIDDTFFEKVDNEEKAYWLGWMYADGCVYENKKGCYFHLTLHNKDKYILENFKKSLKTNRPIHHQSKKNHDGLFVWNKKMYNDLVRLGCTRRKSLTLEFPKNDIVPKHLIRHFIRGYFDGDGCATFNRKNSRFEAKIISSISFLNGYQMVLKELGINKFYMHKRRKSKKGELEYGTIGVGSYKNIKLFYDFLYKDIFFCLERKKQVFENFFGYKYDIFNGISNKRIYNKVELINNKDEIIVLHNVKTDSIKYGFDSGEIYKLINKKEKEYKGYKINNIEYV